MARLLAAKDPNRAFEAAVEYRTLMSFAGEAKAAIASGDAAAKRLNQED